MKNIIEKAKSLLSKIVEKIKTATKKQWIILGSGLIILCGITIGTIYTVEYFQKQNMKKNSSIDFSNPTYEGKQIIVEKDRIIIVEENGSQTIETMNSKNSKYKKATDKIQNNFIFDNIKVEKSVAKTIVSGTIKSKTDKYSTVIVNIKFYKDKQLQGSSSVIVEGLKKNTETKFKIESLGDFTGYQYKIAVEYIG